MGVIGVVVIVGALALTVIPILKEQAQNRETAQKAQEWAQKESQNLKVGPEGWSMGVKDNAKNVSVEQSPPPQIKKEAALEPQVNKIPGGIPADNRQQVKQLASAQQQKQPVLSAQQEVKEKPQETINPFLTEEERASLKITGKAIPIDNLSVTAIIYAPSKAIINGKILKVGDTIDNKEVVDIKPEEVFLKDAQNEYVLKIKDIIAIPKQRNE